MTTLILIETSTEVCSVALSRNGEICWHKENYEGQSHSTLLGKYLQDLQIFARENNFKADAVAVSCGPGSYTGLRIGVSTAKGLCFGLNIPLIAVNTLQTMANHVVKSEMIDNETWLCPMIDARRMEVYTGFYNNNLQLMRPIAADIIDADSYQEILSQHNIICFGNGAKKCKDTLIHPNLKYLDDVYPLAIDMADLAEKAYNKKEFQDVAYFEPFYLKEFIATVGKNKVL